MVPKQSNLIDVMYRPGAVNGPDATVGLSENVGFEVAAPVWRPFWSTTDILTGPSVRPLVCRASKSASGTAAGARHCSESSPSSRCSPRAKTAGSAPAERLPAHFRRTANAKRTVATLKRAGFVEVHSVSDEDHD